MRGAPPPSDAVLANASTSHWSLQVDGRSAPRSEAFGWANAFQVERGGGAKLRFKTPLLRYGLLLMQLALWAAAIVLWRRARQSAKAAS